MSTRCPAGHLSSTTDYCDQCGTPIGVASGAPEATATLDVVVDLDTSSSAVREPCSACGAPRAGDDRYCEACGHDFEAATPGPAVWELVVRADRAQFERLAMEGLEFPGDLGERRFPVQGQRVRIGRTHGRAGETVPEIDLAGPDADPGVSRLHAALERREDGSYEVRDLGSTNGTTLGDDYRPVGTDPAVLLVAGDVIRVGAWTAITVQAR
jgi:hypothetical protein